jgi:hypothetical protein
LLYDFAMTPSKMIWRNGAWICKAHNHLLRFSAGIGWHHYTRDEEWQTEKTGVIQFPEIAPTSTADAA